MEFTSQECLLGLWQLVLLGPKSSTATCLHDLIIFMASINWLQLIINGLMAAKLWYPFAISWVHSLHRCFPVLLLLSKSIIVMWSHFNTVFSTSHIGHTSSVKQKKLKTHMLCYPGSFSEKKCSRMPSRETYYSLSARFHFISAKCIFFCLKLIETGSTAVPSQILSEEDAILSLIGISLLE
jgi:hypothetical protein